VRRRDRVPVRHFVEAESGFVISEPETFGIGLKERLEADFFRRQKILFIPIDHYDEADLMSSNSIHYD
jgi:hypothetical protein